MSGKNLSKHGWIKNPKHPREGEKIGGGHFVFRRGDDTNRIRPSQWPFEYGAQEDATAAAVRLANQFPGYVFDVVKVVDSVFVSPPDASPAEAAVAALDSIPVLGTVGS